MAVGFYNFQELHNEKFQKEIIERFKEIVSKNAFVEGEYNLAFENEFKDFIQAQHLLLVANGTDALEIGLQAYDVGIGDKVAVSAISFFATVECVINRGATPIFVDVDPETGLMCPNSLERMINKYPDIKAVIPVHIYGMPAAIEKIQALCDSRAIKIVEDGAQAHGGFYENKKPIGSSKHLCTFSFYPTKNLGAFGDAGAITANDKDMAQKIISIRNHGRSPNGHALMGRNSRCDHLQAAVLHLKMQKFKEQNEMRREVARKYYDSLDGVNINLMPEKYLELSSWHLFPIRLSSKEEKYALKEHLTKKSIGSALFYEKAMSEEAPCEDIKGEKENSLNFAAQSLCIPMNPFITDAEIKEVAKEIKNFF